MELFEFRYGYPTNRSSTIRIYKLQRAIINLPLQSALYIELIRHANLQLPFANPNAQQLSIKASSSRCHHSATAFAGRSSLSPLLLLFVLYDEPSARRALAVRVFHLFLLYLLVDLLPYLFKQLPHVGPVLRAHLLEPHPVLVRQLLGHRLLHLPLVPQVQLVPHQKYQDVRAGVLVDLLYPVLHVLKGGGDVDGVSEDDGDGALVESGGDVFELLLPGRVPDLHLYLVLVGGYGFDFEVDPDGGGVSGAEGVVAEAEEDVGLAHPRVPDDDCLYHEICVVLLVGLHGYMIIMAVRIHCELPSFNMFVQTKQLIEANYVFH